MCGIAGFLGGNWSDVEQTLGQMNQCLVHRGPDHAATWTDPAARIALAFRRLAIIDLSPAGNQPMASPSGRYILVFNGEIYNHADLRAELIRTGHSFDWRGHSDTETLLGAIEVWGIRGALERATGMFAFALWDKVERSLTLARDRLGEKPLYYGRLGDKAFVFGSELKAIARHPAFCADIDRQALTSLLRFNYVPTPLSIYHGISKLPAGCFLTIDATSDPRIERYWSGGEVAQAGLATPFTGSPEQAIDELEALLDDAIGRQMIADVPLGAFLSGGVDSSTVVAIMQKLSSRPVKTFTVGFHEKGYNEAEHAKAVARHLGTDHTELYVTPEEARAVIPRLPDIYDEPFADSSQIPTHLVSALARREVTVSLSGDGGDELFGGYTRYLLTQKLWNKIAPIPKPMRSAAARALTAIPPAAWTAFGNAGGSVLQKILPFDRLGDKVHKGAPLLSSGSPSELYEGMTSLWRDPANVVIGGCEGGSGDMSELDSLEPISRMMALDMLTYLPDDILAKVDRAAMAVSLETRVPYLDHRVVEFAWRLPLDLKIRGSETKWILRQLLYRHVPRELIERPKMGFGVPIDSWLRGPLRDWAEALLDERRLRDEGYFDPEPIRRTWRAHLSGRVNEQYRLWGVLMFQSWLEAQRPLCRAEPAPVVAC